MVEREIIRLTTDLISIPSVSNNRTECCHVIDFVHQVFEETNYQLERIEQNGVHSLIVSKKGGRDFDLVFFGHLDVVPGKKELFIPKVVEDTIFGRGASDMKGSCAAMIRLFCDNESESFLENTALVLTTDEEVGGDNGIGHLTREAKLLAKTVFNTDGGGILSPALLQKGIYHFRLDAQGSSAHGSRPWKGVSAVLRLQEDIERIYQLFPLASEGDEEKVSLNLGKIQGGTSANSVPESAYALLDLRFTADYSLKDIRDKVSGALTYSSLTELTTGDPVSVSQEDSSLCLLSQILKERGHDVQYTKNNTGSDARWFTEQGSSILLMLPESTNGHIDDEAVSVKGLVELYEIMAELAKRHFVLQQTQAA